MSLTGETKNTISMSNNLSVEVWSSFEMSYLYMPSSYRECGFDLKMPLSQYLQWFWSYEKNSFMVEGGLHPSSPSYMLEGLREHCLAEK